MKVNITICTLLVDWGVVWVWLPSSASIQGAKEDPAQHKEPKFLSKAGWLKKAPGRLLATYKDRYIHVEKTEIVVYENEVYEAFVHWMWDFYANYGNIALCRFV